MKTRNCWLIVARGPSNSRGIFFCCYVVSENSDQIRFHSCVSYYDVKVSDIVFRTQSPSYTQLLDPAFREAFTKEVWEDVQCFEHGML